MLTDSERAALVEELEDMLWMHAPEIEMNWKVLAWNAVLPVVESLLTTRDAEIREALMEAADGYIVAKGQETHR